jgi:hypothetical protein
MAVNKKIAVLAIIALIATLIVAFGLVFSSLPEEAHSIKGNIVYAYLKTYNVSETVDGLCDKKLVSYVLVLNITNPNDVPLHLERVLVELMQSATKDGTSVSGTNGIIRYKRGFVEGETSNYWSPHSSRLVAFTATGELDNLSLDALKLGKGYFIVSVDGYTETDSHVGTGLNLKEVALEITGSDEYVYNTVFMNNERFGFATDYPDLTYEW